MILAPQGDKRHNFHNFIFFSLDKMSHILQNAFLRILKNNHLNKASFSAYRLSSTDLPRTSSSRPQDFLMQTIKSSPSPNDLLNAVSNHLQVMNHKHLVQALRSLFDLQKESRSHYVTEDITKNPTFGSLCQALKRQARALEPNDYIDALKILSYLQVPIDSLIVQTLLQLVRSNINNFNLRQIMFIDFVLTKYEDKNPLVDSLKLALPLVFQIHLPLELDQEDFPMLKEMLHYSCTRQLPDRCINNIITGLMLNDQAMDMQDAKSIVWSLSEVNVTNEVYPTRVKLLHRCFDILTNTLHKLQYEEVLRLAAKLKNRIMDKHMEFYHIGLFDAIAEYPVVNNVPFERSLLIARILTKIMHTNLSIVEYICNMAYDDPAVISSARPNILLAFVKFLSNSNYIPDQHKWDEIKLHISQNRILEVKNTALPWTKFCLELASLGHYDLNVLSKLFSGEVLNVYLSSDLDYVQLLILHEAAKTFCPGYDISPPADVLKKAVDLYPVHSVNAQLEEGLTRGLGGSEYFVNNVQLPNGLVADHIVCLHDGGYPIPLEGAAEGKTDFQKLKLPESALAICILKFNKNCYSLNSDRLRGSVNLLVELLEKQGYPVVPVNVHMWINMPSREKTPYLMREIGYKCEGAGRKLSVS